MHNETSDEALMLRYQSGEAAAFDELYARHRGGLYRFILRQCRLPAAAEELFQDVWMNLIQARSRYQASAQFRTYLFTLAHNRLMDYFRRHVRSEALFYENDDDSTLQEIAGSRIDEPHVLAEARQQGKALLAVLEALPAPQREAFLLYEEAGLSLEEIAHATGASYEAAKSRLRYAIAKLREGLQEYA